MVVLKFTLRNTLIILKREYFANLMKVLRDELRGVTVFFIVI